MPPSLPTRRRPARPLARPLSEPLERRALLAVPAGFDDALLASGITSPTAIEVAPDGRVFVSEQTGSVRVFRNGQLLAQPFLTVPEDSHTERGLYGLAFDPDFAANRFVYVFYTYLLPGQQPGSTENPNRVSRFTADPANPDRALPGSEVVLYQTPGVGIGICHMGGAIEFGPDGKLYVIVGDYLQPANAQSLENPMGKILRLNKDGSIPADNPFYDQTTGMNRAIWATGLRNPFTADFQPGTGRFFVNDVGLDRWEEVNPASAGANFGWPVRRATTPGLHQPDPRLPTLAGLRRHRRRVLQPGHERLPRVLPRQILLHRHLHRVGPRPGPADGRRDQLRVRPGNAHGPGRRRRRGAVLHQPGRRLRRHARHRHPPPHPLRRRRPAHRHPAAAGRRGQRGRAGRVLRQRGRGRAAVLPVAAGRPR